MGLETLKLIIGRQIRILVIQRDDKAHIGLVILQMIYEGSAVGIAAERPTEAVENLPFVMLFRVELPKFFDADPEGLRIAILPQAEFFEQPLGQ